jgi:2-methylisocitrate lyase-like PEP mutase family enzyme
VIPLAEAVGKIRAADAVRRQTDPDFVLIARTDARGAVGGSLDDAIARTNAYLDAGADMGFVEGPTSVAEVERICREVRGPVFYNMTGVSPRFTLAQMDALGIAMTITANTMLRVALTSMYDMAVAMRDEGPMAEASLMQKIADHPVGDLHRFSGLDGIRALEEAYMPAEEMAKYEGTIGYRPVS